MKEHLPGIEITVGAIGTLAMAVADVFPQQVIELTKNTPVELTDILQVTSEAGIPQNILLAAVTFLFMAATYHGAKEMNKEDNF